MIRNLAKITSQSPVVRNLSSAVTFETLALSYPKPFVCHVELNRPDRYNAMNGTMWREIGTCFNHLNEDENTRVIVLSGSGKHFTAGLDLNDMMDFGQNMVEIVDVGRRAKLLEPKIKLYQDSISSLETCVKPVIACIHSACVGAGVDMITAADIRFCSKDAWFQVKEVEIGMAADVGTLQRLPKVIGNQSLVRELCLTARKVQSAEALECGLVGRVLANREETIKAALEMAEIIAERSPVAVQNTKRSLVYSQSRTNQEGLDHIRELNKFLLQSEDFINAVFAQQTREKATFAKL